MPLWIVATPIGTLADLSPRARDVLGSAAVIAAEDTRVTRRLLTAVDVAAPELVALHAHNEDQRVPKLVERAATEDVVVVSDAGTPGVSDPGTRLIAAALQAGVRVLSVPGPSALSAGLAASGFPAAPSAFLGFAPRKGRDGFARVVLGHAGTVVVYEAPTRVADLVRRLAALQPDREAAVCRELSKKFEEVRRAPLGSLPTDGIRGECVLVVGPGEALRSEERSTSTDSLKGIAAALAERYGIKKRDAYQHILALNPDD